MDRLYFALGWLCGAFFGFWGIGVPKKPRQPVPGVYGPEQHAAGFVAKEVG